MIDRNKVRTYSELKKLKTYEERLEYLKTPGQIGNETFGFDRYLNQKYYKSKGWERVRDEVILRDSACDLGILGQDINSKIIIHHMNPIDKNDIINQTKYLKDPEYLICTSDDTHTSIHYGGTGRLGKNKIASRTENDQCPWKKIN